MIQDETKYHYCVHFYQFDKMTIFVIETDPERTKLHFEFEKVISFSKVKTLPVIIVSA